MRGLRSRKRTDGQPPATLRRMRQGDSQRQTAQGWPGRCAVSGPIQLSFRANHSCPGATVGLLTLLGGGQVNDAAVALDVANRFPQRQGAE